MVESYGNERWNKEKLASLSAKASSGAPKYQVPLYCGEFGVFPREESRKSGQLVSRFRRGCWVENRIGWAVWGWDEGFGLDRKMVNGKPVVDAVVRIWRGA